VGIGRAIFDGDIASFDIPASLRPCRKAPICRSFSCALLRRPTNAKAGCFARAALGQATAPPSSVMKSRRFNASPRRQHGIDVRTNACPACESRRDLRWLSAGKITIVAVDIASFNPAQVLQASQPRGDIGLSLPITPSQ
jgi:hypothetical protein